MSGAAKRTPANGGARVLATPDQLRFARVLQAMVVAGFVVLAASFLFYLFGGSRPLVPVADLPRYWGLPVAEYVRATRTPTGWAWLRELGRSDMLNLLGLALLAAAPGVAAFAALTQFVSRREWGLSAITVLKIAVLAFAALNWF